MKKIEYVSQITKNGVSLKLFQNSFLRQFGDTKSIIGVNLANKGSVVKTLELTTDMQRLFKTYFEFMVSLNGYLQQTFKIIMLSDRYTLSILLYM